MPGVVSAVDLGATSGRVILGRVGEHSVELETVHRFPNTPVEIVDGLHWNILELYRNVLEGLRLAFKAEPDLASVGVDSWAVDYALLRRDRMLGTPYHYRDDRSEPGVRAVHDLITPEELYQRNGLQHLPFNTVYQLAVEDEAVLHASDSMLLIPDLITFWLTGQQVCEATNASTTGLLEVRSRGWDMDLLERLGLPRVLVNDLVQPGTEIGGLRTRVGDGLGGSRTAAVLSVGSHDTASAVVGTPILRDDAAYISCGTWGLVGLELEEPVLSDASQRAGFTNEGGVDRTIRFLRNVMGLWLLSESVRQWERDGHSIDLEQLVRAAADVSTIGPVFDVDDPAFLPPGDIPARIGDWFAARGLAAPKTPPEIVRSILESMAEAFARALDLAAGLAGRPVSVVHLVGGGSRNTLLCQLTANRSGRTVLAGPVEATALGNVLVQARARGLVSGDLQALRRFAAGRHDVVEYPPKSRRATAGSA